MTLGAHVGSVAPPWSRPRRERPSIARHREPDGVPSDAALLQRCREGDAAAWDALLDRYERLVFSVAMRNGLSREDAADVTQTTFVALLDGIDRLRDEERLAAWLMTVARRQAWRVRRRNDLVPLAASANVEVVDDGDQIEDLVRAVAVFEALQQLSEPCRELLTALFFDPDEPSYACLAQRLGREIGGIGPLRGRCLDRLRLVLGDLGVG